MDEYSKYRDSKTSIKKSVSAPATMYLKLHRNCRANVYYDVERFPVPDDKVSWNVAFPDYKPVEYTTDRIKSNEKADPIDPWKINKFNQLDIHIDRKSYIGPYYVDPTTNRPRNPVGRTGMTGRGRLYYWGPNHAGDSVITRWLRDQNGAIVRRQVNGQSYSKPVLEFVAVQRKETREWALPGGMVDPGEQVSSTIKREFEEEAAEEFRDKHLLEQLFSNGYKLYESYVDDPRNTDNAWIETVAVNFHDEAGELTKHIILKAGSDAIQVVWRTIDRTLQLYSDHKDIIKLVVDRLDGYW